MRTNHTDVTTIIETTDVQAEPDYLQFSGVSTESIDIENLFTRDITTSGSFDLRQVRNISFGKLLAALPVPTLLLDSSHQIVFFNEAMGTTSSDVDTRSWRIFRVAVSGCSGLRPGEFRVEPSPAREENAGF